MFIDGAVKVELGFALHFVIIKIAWLLISHGGWRPHGVIATI
jgi:hypothetical protein